MRTFENVKTRVLPSFQVHEMMGDIAEDLDVAKEISDAISNPVSFGRDVDEDELERELEELEQEELDKELLTVDSSRWIPKPATAKAALPARPIHPARSQVRSLSCSKCSCHCSLDIFVLIRGECKSP